MDLVHFAVFDSSLGNIALVSKNRRLTDLNITDENIYSVKKKISTNYPGCKESPESFKKVCTLLDRYMKGEKVNFDIECDISYLGIFTRTILEELRKVPYGKLISYGLLGKRAGYENAARAVGQAVGRNPIPIIIPCHRVIRGDGSIGGFSSGLRIKERLLGIEGVLGKIKK